MTEEKLKKKEEGMNEQVREWERVTKVAMKNNRQRLICELRWHGHEQSLHEGQMLDEEGLRTIHGNTDGVNNQRDATKNEQSMAYATIGKRHLGTDWERMIFIGAASWSDGHRAVCLTCECGGRRWSKLVRTERSLVKKEN